MLSSANQDKKLIVSINGLKYYRYPIKTRLITNKDDLNKIINQYVVPVVGKDDIVVISERIVAIIQGRSFLIDQITPSIWANHLYKFVFRHPGGIGLRSPWTMELAIREVGLLRILFAAFFSLLTRPFGFKGLFYILAGNNINAIDGPCDYSLPPSDKSAKLGPKDPQQVVDKLNQKFNINFVIIDANDYGLKIMGISKGIDKKLISKVFADNPMGQSREQTPIIIVSQSKYNSQKK